jgi:hypothetical protein
VVAAAPLDGPIAVALADHRDRFNAIVAQARRTTVGFDLAMLDREIRGPLRRLVEACDRRSSGSGSRVLAAVFEPVVDLIGQHRLGGGTHDALLDVLPDLAGVMIDQPRLVFGSLANAIIHLDRYRAPTRAWLDRVRAAAALGADTTTVLRVGQVAAWSLGLAHYRASALDVASTLKDDALNAALGVETPLSADDTVQRLQDDRWWRPGRLPSDRPVVAHRIGGFRGFGGPFLSPPRVGTRDGHIVVCAGREAWTAHADAWGATLTRTQPDDVTFASAPPSSLAGVQPASAGTVHDIVAVTVATSYRVLIVEPGP